MTITQQDFEASYAQRSGLSVDEVFNQQGQIALRCVCQEDGCEGWAAVSNNAVSIWAHNRFCGEQTEDGVNTQHLLARS